MKPQTLELAKSLYVIWLQTAKGLSEVSKEERVELFKMAAEYSFEAAEVFAEMDRTHNA